MPKNNNSKVNNDDDLLMSEKLEISKSGFNMFWEQANKDQEARAELTARIEKKEKDALDARTKIHELTSNHVNKIKSLERENDKLKKDLELYSTRHKSTCHNVPQYDGNKYHKLVEQAARRIEKEPNEWGPWLGTLPTYI